MIGARLWVRAHGVKRALIALRYKLLFRIQAS
jgi:hypothetical protein